MHAQIARLLGRLGDWPPRRGWLGRVGALADPRRLGAGCAAAAQRAAEAQGMGCCRCGGLSRAGAGAGRRASPRGGGGERPARQHDGRVPRCPGSAAPWRDGSGAGLCACGCPGRVILAKWCRRWTTRHGCTARRSRGLPPWRETTWASPMPGRRPAAGRDRNYCGCARAATLRREPAPLAPRWLPCGHMPMP